MDLIKSGYEILPSPFTALVWMISWSAENTFSCYRKITKLCRWQMKENPSNLVKSYDVICHFIILYLVSLSPYRMGRTKDGRNSTMMSNNCQSCNKKNWRYCWRNMFFLCNTHISQEKWANLSWQKLHWSCFFSSWTDQFKTWLVFAVDFFKTGLFFFTNHKLI